MNEKLPDGFKMTELGPLPEEWEVVRLGDETYFKILPSGIKYFTGKKEYLSTSSVQEWKIIKPECLIEYANRPSRANMQPLINSVWFARMIGTTKVYSFADNNREEVDKYILSTGFCGILCKNTTIPEYIKFIFLSNYFNTTKDSLCSGTTQRAINNENIGTIQIPLPPLSEQKKIAAVLSAVQSAKEKTEAVIKAAKELKKSLMKHLFTYGPVSPQEAEKVPLKETEIGPVPEDWEVVRLGDVAENRKETVDPKKEDISYVGLEHITPGIIRLNNYGNSRDVKSLKSKFYKDDILYAKLRPYLDKGVLAEFEGICSTDIIVIQLSKKLVNPQYVAYFVHTSKFLYFATKSMTGVNHPRTNWSILKTFKLPLPPLPIQQKIASILSAIDAKIEAEENKKKALEDLFKTLLHNLMTANIRVNQLEVTL